LTANEKRRQLLVIGLDGVTWKVLKPLVERGVMPNLRRFMETGYHSTLLSTMPPVSAPAWTTFITGKNPGKHGILQFVNLKAGKEAGEPGVEVFPGGFSVVNARSIQGPTLWEHLGQAGLRVGIVNVPMTYPPVPVNGYMITGMLTPPGAPNYTYPPELTDELEEEYEIELALHEREFDFDAQRLLERLIELMEKRSRTTLRLLEHRDWDFAMVVFTSTDRLQHRFWKYLVPGDVQENDPEGRQFHPLLEEYHQRLDRQIGLLAAVAGPDAHVVFLSDHGFGPRAERVVHRETLVSHLDLAETRNTSWIGRVRSLVEGTLGLTVTDVRRVMGRVLGRRLASRIEGRARLAEQQARSHGRAYLVTLHEYVGGAFINPAHGSQGGAGSESGQSLQESIAQQLRALVDPETGQRLIQAVYPRDELYHGTSVEECPDLVFVLAPGYGLAGGIGPGNQLVSTRGQDPQKQGTHRQDGILVMAGPAIRPARAQESDELVDVTATILYLLDQAIPSDMDSQVISRAICPDYWDMHPVRSADTMPNDQKRSDSVWDSEDEARLIEERLRGIGYLE
jgi:predicted AlkP superfamily phosphohydrolase/phosphomutase